MTCDSPSCRICLSAGEGRLVSPCAGCRGTSAFAHATCIEEFYIVRGVWPDLTCPTCKHYYEGALAVRLGHIGLNMVEEGCGPARREVAVMLANLGNAYGRLGDATRQCELLERALAILERESAQCEVAMILAHLGNAYGALGDATKKCEFLERALAMREREYGPTHREVAITLANLGNAYGAIGDALRQRDLLERSLVILEQEYGPSHSNVAAGLASLGQAYGALGDPKRQLELLERALAIFEREYGPAHSTKVAVTLANLGNAHGALGNTPRKCELLERALGILEREYGSAHRDVAIILTNLSNAYGSLGDQTRQRGLLERSLAIGNGGGGGTVAVEHTLACAMEADGEVGSMRAGPVSATNSRSWPEKVRPLVSPGPQCTTRPPHVGPRRTWLC